MDSGPPRPSPSLGGLGDERLLGLATLLLELFPRSHFGIMDPKLLVPALLVLEASPLRLRPLGVLGPVLVRGLKPADFQHVQLATGPGDDPGLPGAVLDGLDEHRSALGAFPVGMDRDAARPTGIGPWSDLKKSCPQPSNAAARSKSQATTIPAPVLSPSVLTDNISDLNMASSGPQASATTDPGAADRSGSSPA